MRIAFGRLGWRPAEFWASTMTELFEGMNGWNEANGVEEKPPAPSDDEMAELLAKYGN
ncbi:MAG: phage tail assembly chaperone [Rhizobium sp.]|nr:phage tail assembly chaperone [Rhizobium sp.]